jgi:hypothetical protein
MKLERSPEGLQATLSSSGLGRFIGAAFLGLWLLFWTAGEGFALWMFVRGAWALLTGEPPEPGRDPLNAESALPMGLFLLLWLTFWTFGGIMAGREFLRLLFGRDIILARAEAVEIRHSYGLFRTGKDVPRDEIRRFYQRPRRGALCVETNRGSIELTRLGTPADRSELEQVLKTEFMLQEEQPPASVLPKDWRELPSAEGESVLVKNPETRGKQALVMWIISFPLALAALYVISLLPEKPDLWAVAVILALLAAAIASGAAWLAFGRNEWVLYTGRMVLQRRFRGQRTQRFEAVALELYEDNSGDNGPSYLLNAVAANAPARSSLSPGATKQRRCIYVDGNDPTGPHNLGRWLSQRCQMPFDDQTTTEAKARQYDAWKAQVAGTGRFGQAVVRIMDRMRPGA